MKLLTYLNAQAHSRVGFFANDAVYDVLDAAKILGLPHLESLTAASQPMLALIQAGDGALESLKAMRLKLDPLKPVATYQELEASHRVLAPLPRPVSLRDGYAFRQHVETARRNRGVPMIPEFDLFPVVYYSNALATTGPGPVAVQKQALEKLDFELEAAIVIGKAGKNIPASKADSHIFGYCIFNDWSARALQMEEMKLNLGPAKGKDFASSFGPFLVTRDELTPYATPSPQGERHRLKMKAWINGKLLSEGMLSDMNWSFGQIVERASYGVRLEPGEVIGSGTVGTGCLLELNGSKITDNLWLKPGDVVELEIEHLGRLKNTVTEASESYQH